MVDMTCYLLMYSFALKFAFKQTVLFTTKQQSNWIRIQFDARNPVLRGCTKHRIELLHNAPICLELWSLVFRSLATSSVAV